MKKCTKCKAPIVRSPHANNVKYCTACRVQAYKYTEYRTAWQATARAKQATRPQADKMQCYICNLYYKKVISHAWQVHGVHEREYKDALGLDHQSGVKTRYKPQDKRAGKYKRSEQTLRRLQKL